MKRHITITAALVLLLAGMLGYPMVVTAQTLADYTSTPPFLASTATPNVLIILDNSGSMGRRAQCLLGTGSNFTTCPVFDETVTYGGLFDSMQCYTYDATDTRFEPTATAKAAVSTACANTEWDGNFMNWATLRRIDMAKIALIGGSCAGARNADGTCPPTGSPSMVTLKGRPKGFPSGGTISTPAVAVGAGPKKSNGRVPSSIETNATTLYFHLPGNSGPLGGSFCTDNDTDAPQVDTTSASECAVTSGGASDSDSYVENRFVIRVAVPSEPTGVIQNTGAQVRFGLMEYIGNDGGGVMVPIGSKQYKVLNGSTLTTHANNMVAMIQAIEDTFNTGNTPMAETLYEAIRYVAQVNSSLFPSSYVYPLAYSPAANLNAAGTGSLGSGEESVLTGTEACPSEYINNACGRDPYFHGSNHTPAWASPSAQVTCCKTFIIIFTDGDSQQDQTVPAALKDYADAIHGLHCTGGNSTIHAPNGTCNSNEATPPTTLLGEHKTDFANSGSHYLDDVAYWGHTVDLRQATIPVINEAGHDLPGFQNVTIYSFFAFAQITNREFLMQVARQGGFEDKNANTKPDLVEEYDTVNNFTGAQGADGYPDTYFESSNVLEMKDKLAAAIASILQRSGSGSSLSVLATSSTGEGAVYQAFFYPSTVEGLNEVKWTGYTQGLFVDAFGNLREDSAPADGKLILSQDKIINPRYDSNPLSPTFGSVLVDRFADANGDGKADSATPTDTVGLKDMSPIWEGGKQLALKDPATRRLLTWVDSDNDGLVDAGEQKDFSTANSATLAPYLRAGAAPFTADNIINFIRGTQVAGLRNRELTVAGAKRVWKLGDVIDASPIVVASPRERFDVIYGDSSYTAYFQKYKNRRQMAYVGANDGMLHAFNVGYYHRGDDSGTSGVVEHGWFTRTPTDNSGGPALGEENWGFIPYHLLPQLKWLTDPNYTHVYYVDLKPRVMDARIFADDGPTGTHPGGWGTILISGMRFGGSCKDCTSGTGGPPMTVNIGGTDRYFYSAYFVLDITDPEADPKLLWSFADEKLGLTTSYPAVVRVNPAADGKTDNTNAKWYAVFGSGPTGYDASVLLEGQLFVVDLQAGPGAANVNVIKFLSGESKSFMGDLIAMDANLDYRVDALYMGNVVDKSGSGGAPWSGSMYRLTTGGGSTTPATTWGVGQKPTVLLRLFTCSPKPCPGTIPVGPIAAAPAVTLDDGSNTWLFFGTGRLYTQTDKTNTDTQSFFGVKDPVVKGGCIESSQLNCQMNDLVNVATATVCVVCTGGTTQVTGISGVTDLTGTSTATLQGLVASKDGWWTTLPATRERVLVPPTLVGGVVLFPTYTPESNVCSSSGSGSLYALFYLTGSAYKESVIGTEASGSNTNVKRSTSLGQGLWSQMSVQVTAQTTDATTNVTGTVNVCTQSSTSDTACVRTNLPGSVVSRYVSWANMRE